MRQQFLQIACSILTSAALVTPALAQSETAAVTGVVRDRRGVPQIDALVQLLRPDASVAAVARTNGSGVFLLEDLLPGVYQLKTSEDDFLPTLRKDLHLSAHRRTVADVTLSTLFEAVQWLPAQRRAPGESPDDWKWTLRSDTNRPVLRFSDEGPMMVSEGASQPQSRARLTTTGGLRVFGDGGLRQGMEYEGTGREGEHTLMRTSLNATDNLQADYMAAYEKQIAPGRIVRTVAAYTDMPDLTGGPYGAGRYQAATLRTAETTDLTPLLRTEIGNELLAMRLMGVQGGTAVSSRPFGSLIVHFGDTTVMYRAATSPMVQDAGAMADENTLLPPVAQRDGIATLEHGLHQEISLRHTADHGATLQLTAYHDRIEHPLVQGSGMVSDLDAAGGNLLVDPVSGVFRASADAYAGYGFVANAVVPLSTVLAISGEVAAGPTLSVPYMQSASATEERSVGQMLTALRPKMTPAVAIAAEGRLPRVATYWRTSYRWQAPDRVSPVNPYGMPASEAYLSVLLRQPVRVGRILPGGMQAVIDMRNLLAQGYCPFITPDGSTLFFAQADRSIAGGVAFTF